MLDGRMLEFDVQPRIIDNRTMVPMRVIFEELGANVEWDGTTRTITATSSDLVVRTTVGNRVIDVNGNRITMDVAPVIVDGRTLVPVRFVSEAFGANVEWDANTRTVYIFSEPPNIYIDGSEPSPWIEPDHVEWNEDWFNNW